jgi:glyoxylase-like metal-dependent hydrolase (beta-lactamase superfamily II)
LTAVWVNNETIADAIIQKMLSWNASTTMKTNYNPVPENAHGPTMTQKDYIVEPLGDGLYFLSNGAYSHSHKDHIGAANIFSENATYIAQQETANQLKLSNDSNDWPLPTVTFAKNYSIKTKNNNETILDLDYPGVTHEAGDIFIYAPKQKALMFVDVIYPGWVPYDGLGASENVNGFIDVPNKIINNYKVDKFIGGHLTRIGTMEDVKTHQEFLSDLKSTTQQILKDVTFADIAKVVGPSNPGNPWAITKSYLDTMTDRCTKQMTDKWKDKLGGLDIFLDSNCAAMLQSLRVD